MPPVLEKGGISGRQNWGGRGIQRGGQGYLHPDSAASRRCLPSESPTSHDHKGLPQVVNTPTLRHQQGEARCEGAARTWPLLPVRRPREGRGVASPGPWKQERRSGDRASTGRSPHHYRGALSHVQRPDFGSSHPIGMRSSPATPPGHLSPSPLVSGPVVTARRWPWEMRPFLERGLPRPRRTREVGNAAVAPRPGSGFVQRAPRRAGDPSLQFSALPATLAAPRMSPPTHPPTLGTPGPLRPRPRPVRTPAAENTAAKSSREPAASCGRKWAWPPPPPRPLGNVVPPRS